MHNSFTRKLQMYLKPPTSVTCHGRKVKCGGIFRDKLCQKTISKKQPILWEFWGQILLEICRFCPDQSSIFNISLTEVIICSFNNNTLHKSEPMAKLSTSLLKCPVFQTGTAVVLGCFKIDLHLYSK